ncbi:MAG: Uma2 family endonuclease [Mogibacterium sp.]|nr:Uma2 family endonuclease [Mogibacterium sp.]
MTIEELRRLKEQHHYTNEMIAERSGVPLATVQKIFAGVTRTPRYHTMKALEAVFRRGDTARYDKYPGEDGSYRLRESDAALDLYGTGDSMTTDRTYAFGEVTEFSKEGLPIHPRYRIPIRKQGEYTVRDYYRIPDDVRVELIDGVIYDLAAPSKAHQVVAGTVFTMMNAYAMQHDGPCVPVIAPSDVRLDRDDSTIVQPDIYVVCQREEAAAEQPDDEPAHQSAGAFQGAPDFVLEVVSPSTRRKDLIIKLNKYMTSGVREYWIVDPAEETVTVYDFERNELGRRYTFEDTVPVAISEGAFAVDFRIVRRQMERAEQVLAPKF